jgi:RNA ligase
MIRTIDDLRALVLRGFTDWASEGAVTVKESGDLLLFNYDRDATWERPFEVMSRGLILNRVTGEVVARPFDKFFNWGERGLKGTGHIDTCTEKMDGSLGILYRTDSGFRIATRGSFTGEQALWATEFLKGWDLSDLDPALTLLFEIIYPENRVVLDYGDLEDLVLLAARNRFNGRYLPFFPMGRNTGVTELAWKYGFGTPQVCAFNNIAAILEAAGTLDGEHEGWVIEMSDGSRWKIKGDRYLELHRLITGLSLKSVLQAIRENTLDHMKAELPEEFAEQVAIWEAQVRVEYDAIRHAVDLAYREAPKDTRKEFAIWVMANHRDIAPLLFNRLDGQDIGPKLWPMIEDRLKTTNS